MKFSYSAVWNDTVKLTRQHLPMLAAIAGVFIFLPGLVLAVFLPPPQPASADPGRVYQIMLEYFRAAAPWFLLQWLASMVGTAAMLRLVFARDITVGGALVFGLKLLPFYFLLSIMIFVMVLVVCLPVGIAVAALGATGLADPTARLLILLSIFLTLIAVFYLFGRVMPAAPAMVAENRRSPIDALTRSVDLTKGRGWSVFGLFLIVTIAGGITVGVAKTLFGIIFLLAAGRDIGTLLTSVASGVLSAGFGILIVMLYAAIYRALTASDTAAATE